MAVAAPYLIQIGVSVAMSYLAGKLLAKDPDGSVTKDFKATPLTDRGSPITRLVGRDIVGPCMTWAGDRTSETDDGGGKGVGGGAGEGVKTYFEDGWHVICVGPARRLWSIVQNGKTIFVGPIDSASHPSGTLVDLGQKGKFRIYWGEADQPENSRLGEADALAITSRWPYLCYVEWVNKRLGASPVWPRLSYEVEVWPYHTKLAATPSWFGATKSLVGSAISVFDTLDGPPGTNYVEVIDGTNDFKPSQYAKLTGVGVSDGDYIIDHVEKFKVGDVKHRRIFLGVTMSGLTDTGTIQAYEDNLDDGVNAAHIIYEYLFTGMPHGKGLPIDLFDIDSLETVGLLCQEEQLRSTSLAVDFKHIDAALGELLQDIGVALVLEPTNGLLTFRPIRETADVVPLSADLLTGDPVEVNTSQIDEEPSNRRQFQYRDRTRNYTPMPVTIDDDGQAELEQVFGQSPIDLPTVRDFTTATTIAQRRNQESYSNEQMVRVKANREALMVAPGRLFSVPDLDIALLMLEVERQDPQSGEVLISAIPNYYGVTVSEAVIDDGGGFAPDVEETDEDEVFIPIELPQSLNASGQVEFEVARIRNAATVVSGQIYLSADDITFLLMGQEAGKHTGGTLDTAVSADSASLLDPGPTFTAQGPDILQALDLSAAGSEADWRKGRQMAVVSDGVNHELWYVRWIETLGGGQYRAREVLRHRLCTEKLAFSTGDWIVLFPKDDITAFQDLILGPEETVYVKSQPVGNAEVPLDDISSVSIALYGLGVRPLPVTALRAGDAVGRCSNTFSFPNDVSIRWGYRQEPGPTLSSPAGLPAGDPVLVRPVCDGTIRISITDPNDGDAEVFTVDLPADNGAEYVFTQAQIKTAFGLTAGFQPLGGKVYFRSATASPTPTNPLGISFTVGGNPGGGNWTAFTPREMDYGSSTLTSQAMTISSAGARGAVFVMPSPLVNPGSGPTGLFTLQLKISAIVNGGASISVTTAWVCRFNSVNEVQEAKVMNAFSGSGAFSAPTTLSTTLNIVSWSAWNASDKIGVVIGFLDAGGGATDITLDLNDTNSFLQASSIAAEPTDFDVHVSVIKGSQESTVEDIHVDCLGGTVT